MQVLSHRLHDILFPFYRCGVFELSSTLIYPQPRKIPQLPPEIWYEIFHFATYIRGATIITPFDPFTLKHASNNVMGTNTPYLSMGTKRALVLVCRSWSKIAVPLLYEHIVIPSPRRAKLVLSALQARCVRESSNGGSATGMRGLISEYGQWIRHIEIYTYARGGGSLDFLKTVFLIFTFCPNLRILSGTWIRALPCEFLESISRVYGKSLHGLCWNESALDEDTDPPSHTTPQFFASFQSLHVLDLRGYHGPHSSNSEVDIPASLPRLREVVLSTTFQSLKLATNLSLPALQYLTLEVPSDSTPLYKDTLDTFLRVHGQSLISVDLPSSSSTFDREPDPTSMSSRFSARYVDPSIFLKPDLCPNLISLTFSHASPQLEPHGHQNLRRVGIRGVRSEYLYPNKSTKTVAHLKAISRTLYPNLEVVRTVGFLVAAESDPLVKDVFIWWSEKFDKKGIDFQDGEGILWFYADPDTEAGADSAVEPSGQVKLEDKEKRRCRG